MAAVDASSANTFDPQAVQYDARAGLPTAAGAAVARAIVETAEAGAADLVVELGAGTGEIGVHLCQLPVRYVGLDYSPAMLEVFRAKLDEAPASLLVADGNARWPLSDDAVAVLFASRVIHLLDAEHVVREALRVCHPAGLVMLGRVQRDRDGLKERLGQRRREILRAAGNAVPHGEQRTRHVVEGFMAAGGESVGRQIVAEWTGTTTAAELIAWWETLPRMGSVAVDAATRAGILDDLREWARAAVGDLERPEAYRERYALDVIRLP
jgi:ubiquinone/menaquinone biosynthesis C-methylase UbiE